MPTNPVTTLREQLTFEQQALFDRLYAHQSKQQGTATILSMPILGTLGLQFFYLGDILLGIISLLFSWLIIPTTFFALFELFSGGLKRHVDAANERIAKRVYDEVLRNTPSPASAPAAVREQVIAPSAVVDAAVLASAAAVTATEAPTAEPAAEVVAEVVEVSAEAPAAEAPTEVITETPDATLSTASVETAAPVSETVVEESVAITDVPTIEIPSESVQQVAIADAADISAVPVEEATVSETVTQEQTETVETATAYTLTESAAAWQAGMDAPVVVEESRVIEEPVSEVSTDTIISETQIEEIAEPALSDAQFAADSESLELADASTENPLAADGVLVFVEDVEPLTTDTATTLTVETPDVVETVTETTHTEETEATSTVIEAAHSEHQHYHDGKLVEASRHDVLLTGSTQSLIEDSTSLLAEVEARAAVPLEHTGWVDMSPLNVSTSESVNPPVAEAVDTPIETASTPAAQPQMFFSDGGGNGSDVSTVDSTGGSNIPGGDTGGTTTDTPGGDVGGIGLPIGDESEAPDDPHPQSESSH
jgi:hypothetical protein